MFLKETKLEIGRYYDGGRTASVWASLKRKVFRFSSFSFSFLGC
jgi:hypothetical protein